MRWYGYDEIDGCGILEHDPWHDERGMFSELFNRTEIAEKGIPLPWQWAQDNVSFSWKGVQRGFHVQRVNPQGKLVTCLHGKIMDVCLDVRPRSPTFLKITRCVLSHERLQSFYLPPGTAHAFLAMEDSLVHYKCSTAYHKESDTGIDATSPEVAMVWPPGQYFRSPKDRALPKLVDFLNAGN